MTLDEAYRHIKASYIHHLQERNAVFLPQAELIAMECIEKCKQLKEQKAAGAKTKVTCRMIPLEPDCRGYTDVFICTHCHQHIHLGFIRKEYRGNFCIECGADVELPKED